LGYINIQTNFQSRELGVERYMSGTDYDRIIAQERKVLASIKEHGDKVIPDLKRVTASYVREFSIYLMRGYYSNRPEVAKKLGPEKVEELKGEFTNFLDTLPEYTSKRLDDTQIWLHRVEIPPQAISDMTYSYQLEKKSYNALDQAIRELIGLAGSLLIKYGFVEVGTDYEWQMTPAGIPQYVNDLPSRDMNHYKALDKLMNQYKDILVEYVYAIQNLRKAEDGKRSAGAR
jgi:hypothetical protein